MKQLIFLAPSLERAVTVVSGLSALGISEDDVHIVADDPEQIEQAHLHKANPVDTTEIENDLDWGMIAGGSLGLLAGLSVVGGGPAGFIAGSGIVWLSSLAGIGLGGWLGTLIGEQTPRSEMEKYRSAIVQGKVLMVVEVPDEKLPPAFSLIRENCPQALIEMSKHSFDRSLAA